ncbi:MAG: T9SS type A sorting domain-containing protein [Bacteroidota bacterium]|nr:T9SS type A sorting domain-containing protein [Bacteroidota bacterium]
MQRSILITGSFCLALAAWAQPVLLPSIGIGLQPSSADQICTLPFETPPLESNGRPAGENAADFSLYDLQGDQFNLEEALLEGKPVLMIAGSYTCPVFRNKMPLINQIQQTYGDQLTTVVVYTAEAHPDQDISPYFGAVNTHEANFAEGILYQQPTTYGQRLSIAADMLAAMTIEVPVFIDGPCNEWWNYYGPAPNISYLIGTGGDIVSRHTWFDKYPQDILCDIDQLLDIPNDCSETFGGQFSMEWLSNDTAYGPSGTTITVNTRILNPTMDPVLVEIHRLENNMPMGWNSSICADICYLPQIDFAETVVPAGGQQDLHYYFYSSGDPAHGHARVGVRNAEDVDNGYIMNFHAFSSVPTSIGEGTLFQPFAVWPNPASEMIQLRVPFDHYRITINDIHGRLVLETAAQATVDVSGLPQGIYIITCWKEGMMISQPARIQIL